MKKAIIFLMAFMLLFVGVSCSKENSSEVIAATEGKNELLTRFSYTVGYSNSEYLLGDSARQPDVGYLIRGILDFSVLDKEPLISMEELTSSYESFMEEATGTAELGRNLTEKKIMKLGIPESLHDKYSYSLGYILASNVIYQFGDMDLRAFADGLRDGLFQEVRKMTEEEMNASVGDYSAYVQKKFEETIGKEKKANLEEADNFFKKNASYPGIVIPNDYVQLKFKVNGPKTEKVELGDNVHLNYRLTNLQGEVLDQGKGVTFPMTEQMIPGFVEGCVEMYVGDSATVYVHPEHGYGEYGPNGIGPNRLLIFDIDIIGIEK